MRLTQALHHFLAPETRNVEEVESYRHVGGQVLEVVGKLEEPGTAPTAVAYAHIARALELVADGLVAPYIDANPPERLPTWVRAQAVQLYRPIPELVTAAKQEAIDPGGTRDVVLPWILKGRVGRSSHDDWHSLEVYGQAVKALLEWTEVTVAGPGAVKGASLYFAEATTNLDSASHLLLGFREQTPSFEVRKSIDDYLWKASAYAIGALQEQASPGVCHGMDIDTMLEGADGKPGDLTVLAFDEAGHAEVVRHIARNWNEATSATWESEGFHHEHHHEHHHRRWDDD